MSEQISEPVGTLETDVAVIQSNYVRRDEFSALREEMGIAFAKADAKIDVVRTELNSKMDIGFARLDGKIDQVRSELNGKIDRAIVTMLRWTFGLQITIVTLAVAAAKYL